MPLNDYEKLKETLNLRVAIDWLIKDVKDDFYPDPIRYADIKKYKDDYIRQRQHRFLQFDSVKYHREDVPKKSLMLREAIWLHPTHRILYLAILRHFFKQLDLLLLPCSYAYRCNKDGDQDDYPFNDKIRGWKQFKNDYRSAAVEPSMGAILVTDLSSYYDHISCEQMCQRIHSLLGSTISRENRLVLANLEELLTHWSNNRYGIPQNHDPSSFLGNLYLHNVDHEMSALGYQYFRFVDDIRVVTKTKRQAILALHDLQRALLKHRLFLATDKTHIYTRDDPAFEEELDVEDDVILSEAERTINKGCHDEIEALVDKLFIRLQKHSGRNANDRMFRAYSNRLLDAALYSEIRGAIIPKLHEFVIPRLKSHPYRSDYWVKMLRIEPSADVVTVLQELLVDEPSVFAWQRFHLWRLALYLNSTLPITILNQAIKAVAEEESHAVASQAAVYIGKYGSNTQKETLFSDHFTSQKSYLIQRGILIALQELPSPVRDQLYDRAVEINSDHKQLVEYLRTIAEPNYMTRLKPTKCCVDVPVEVEPPENDGLGLVDGEVIRFPLINEYEEY